MGETTMSRNLFAGLGIESLESRTMMAGDVTAALAGGDLVLNGDNDSNEVVIRATNQVGQFVIEGLNGTTINGQASATISGVNDDFRINLRNGNNALLLTAERVDGNQSLFQINDDVQIRTGNGNDVVVFDNVRVIGNTSLNTGDGDDTAVFFESRLAGDLRGNMGNGDDFIGLDSSRVDGRVRTNLGSGNDYFITFDSNLNDRVDANMGSGDDLMGLVNTTFEDDLRVNGSNGLDRVLHENTDVNGDADLRSIEVEAEVPQNDIGQEFQDNPGLAIAIELILSEGTAF
jgi:hypothetical protein